MTDIVISHYLSPIGDLTLGVVEGALCLCTFSYAHAARFMARNGLCAIEGDCGVLEEACSQLSEYFAGKRTVFQLPLRFLGTDFQVLVWRYLVSIPFGESRCYQQQAVGVGRPSALRAVAGANGQNPIVIIVPCHRVMGKDGTLTGFSAGLWRKEFLLHLESIPFKK